MTTSSILTCQVLLDCARRERLRLTQLKTELNEIDPTLTPAEIAAILRIEQYGGLVDLENHTVSWNIPVG